MEGLARAAGHADRHQPLKDSCRGLLLDGERKSVEPMAARLHPDRVPATHPSLHHFVARSPWSDEAVLAAVRRQVLPAIQQRGPVVAWIVDDTGIPKKGRHSVGVARESCGQLGKQENCQVAVSLSVAAWQASLPVAWPLYLPTEWAEDRRRRTADAPGASRGLARRAACRVVAVGGVAAPAGRGRAEQVLAVELARPDAVGRVGPAGQAPLDCGAGLLGAETRTGVGAFRSALVARIPSSCDAVHRDLRVPGSRAEPFFRLSAPGSSNWRRPSWLPTTGRGAAGRDQQRCERNSIATLRRVIATWRAQRLRYKEYDPSPGRPPAGRHVLPLLADRVLRGSGLGAGGGRRGLSCGVSLRKFGKVGVRNVVAEPDSSKPGWRDPGVEQQASRQPPAPAQPLGQGVNAQVRRAVGADQRRHP